MTAFRHTSVRGAFTLLELLVVVGIMGMLGVAGTAGYSALQRGMNERAAVAVASAALRAAQERANVDRKPVAVYCYNRLLKEPTGDDDNGVVVGVITAIRQSGRITKVASSYLYDEFADLDLTYESIDGDSNRKGSGNANENDATEGGSRKLYLMPAGQSTKMEYSIVSDRVLRRENAENVVLFEDDGNTITTNLLSSCFVDIGTGTRRAGSWKVGDPYAYEFIEVQLPNGYVFGTSIPHQAGDISVVKGFYFDIGEDASDTVEVNSTKPNASGMPTVERKAGVASAKSDKAV